MADQQLRVSPLKDWAGVFAGLPDALALSELPLLRKLNLRSDCTGPAAGRLAGLLGTELPGSNRATQAASLRLLWLGPDEWLLVTEPGTDAELAGLAEQLRAAIGAESGAVTEVSGQYAALRLAGPGARELLAMGCALDLHPSVAPAGTCVQTLLAQTGLIITVLDAVAPEFLLLVRASYANYLAGWLVDAAAGLQTG